MSTTHTSVSNVSNPSRKDGHCLYAACSLGGQHGTQLGRLHDAICATVSIVHVLVRGKGLLGEEAFESSLASQLVKGWARTGAGYPQCQDASDLVCRFADAL